MSEPQCSICGDIGVVEAEGCNCGMGANSSACHKPWCGFEPCSCGLCELMTLPQLHMAFARCSRRARATRNK